MTVLHLWRRRSREVAAEELPDPVPRPAEAFVLSGGGSLGAAQVGAMRAVLEAGVRPDVVVGCSVGALNAACLAVDPGLAQLDRLEAVWLTLTRRDVFPDRRSDIVRRLLRRDVHLYSPGALADLVRRCVPVPDLADLQIPCHVVTTDLLSGETCWWTRGCPEEVLLASACLPGLFPPVPLGDSLHVDGAVTCPVPVQRALATGARRVWVFDVCSDFHPWWEQRSMSAFDVLLESFAISRSHLVRRESLVSGDQRVVVLPSLPIGRHDMRDFSRTPHLLETGLTAGRRMVAGELAVAEVEPLAYASGA